MWLGHSHHTTMKNTQKYAIIFAKDEKGTDVKYRFVLSMNKPVEKMMGIIMQQDGVDRMEAIGRYTADIAIGRAFDADEVLTELKSKLDVELSNIIL